MISRQLVEPKVLFFLLLRSLLQLPVGLPSLDFPELFITLDYPQFGQFFSIQWAYTLEF